MRRCRSWTFPGWARSTFEAPARDDFRCLGLAYRALDADRSLPIVLNAANEVAVAAFLQGTLRFTAIPDLIARTMDAHGSAPADTLAEVRRIDAWARAQADACGITIAIEAFTPRFSR